VALSLSLSLSLSLARCGGRTERIAREKAREEGSGSSRLLLETRGRRRVVGTAETEQVSASRLLLSSLFFSRTPFIQSEPGLFSLGLAHYHPVHEY
jgi:hypothetical protein